MDDIVNDSSNSSDDEEEYHGRSATFKDSSSDEDADEPIASKVRNIPTRSEPIRGNPITKTRNKKNSKGRDGREKWTKVVKGAKSRTETMNLTQHKITTKGDIHGDIHLTFFDVTIQVIPIDLCQRCIQLEQPQ